MEIQNGGRVFPAHAYTVYVSVQNTLKSLFLYGLRKRKLWVIIWRPKMAVEFSRTCLYNVCERTKYSKIATFVWTSYEKVLGNQLETQNAGPVSHTCLYNIRERGKHPQIAIFVRISYGGAFGNWTESKWRSGFPVLQKFSIGKFYQSHW